MIEYISSMVMIFIIVVYASNLSKFYHKLLDKVKGKHYGFRN